MSTNSSDSLVLIYSTPLEFDAELVKTMLADEEIPSTVENSTGPFLGLTAMPCQVFVSAEHESLARQLVESHELKHRKRIEREENEEAETQQG